MRETARACFAKWIVSADYQFKLTPLLEETNEQYDRYRFLELSPIVKAVVGNDSLDIWCYFNFPDEAEAIVVDFNLPSGCSPIKGPKGWFNAKLQEEHQHSFFSFYDMVVRSNFEHDISMLNDMYLADSVIYLLACRGDTDGGILKKTQWLHKLEKWASKNRDDWVFARPLAKRACL